MTRLVLHIGHPKTGTTALQFTLAANRQRLSDAGILYPAAGEEHKHAVLAPYLMKVTPTPATRRRTKLDDERLAALSREVWESLKASIEETKPEVVVLSAESFWTATSIDAAKSFNRYLSEIASEIQVVGYLRSPPQTYLSRLNQKVRMMQDLPRVEGSFFRHPITAYSDAGFEDISLHIFDKSRLQRGDIVTDFCQRFLPELTQPLDSNEIRRTNESISVEALALMRKVSTSDAGSALFRRRPGMRSRFLKALRKFDRELPEATRPQLHHRIHDAVVASSTDLTWLRDEKGIEFPDVDYHLVGTASELDFESVRDIAALCPFNSARLAELRDLMLGRFANIKGIVRAINAAPP